MSKAGSIRAIALTLILSLSFALPAAAQTGGLGTGSAAGTAGDTAARSLRPEDLAADANAQLALSVANYRVTAGDIYTLAYMAGTQMLQYTIPVDSTYRIRIANLGVIDSAGLTFSRLKAQVETIVTNNYPMSGVQFVLSRPAVFKVYMRGEVETAKEVTAWGLNRLSSLTAENLTERSSLRDITVKSANGQSRVYDLFRAQRGGEPEGDPYLRPDDVVTFGRSERTVTVEGAVERPGKYQLLGGENLKELIEYYGAGFTPVADRTRMELQRYVKSASVSGDKIFLEEGSVEGNYALEHYDVVTVPAITDLTPVMFMEGAVGRGTGDDAAELTVSNRVVIHFNKGEDYGSLVRRYQGQFTPVSDTQNAYVVRRGEQHGLNLNPMLYDAEYRSGFLVEENDVLIIPFRQYFVTVAGAVMVPGRYPYIPDREWDYYIALAGGFVPGRNSGEAVDIRNVQGERQKKGGVITPETIITARTNDFLFYFNQYAPVITTTLTILTTFLSLQAYLNR